ncbi:MAG: sodium-dependent bicarbonate transport family permease, partial [Halobacteriovoraceae bacterium]|nr:sodium-dependent bicarbonate transport family permease [Halobacteriovoraceae bacterium]
MDPIILFYLFGLLAGVLKSPIKLPESIYKFLSAYLLIAIGLKGGVELHENSSMDMIPKVVLISLLGLVLPLIAYPILKKLGRFKKEDAASIAAHYGSVSVGTFAVGITFLQTHTISFESYVPLFVVILEIPAIIVGIILARGISKDSNWKEMLQEIFLGKSIVLMVIGLMVGWISGPENMAPLKPLFFDLFKGMLGLFLLEMGHVTSQEIKSLKKYGAFLLGFGVAMPVASGCIGALVGLSLGLSVGGITILAILAGSASYIAVPAAMRISVPEANPS